MFATSYYFETDTIFEVRIAIAHHKWIEPYGPRDSRGNSELDRVPDLFDKGRERDCQCRCNFLQSSQESVKVVIFQQRQF